MYLSLLCACLRVCKCVCLRDCVFACVCACVCACGRVGVCSTQEEQVHEKAIHAKFLSVRYLLRDRYTYTHTHTHSTLSLLTLLSFSPSLFCVLQVYAHTNCLGHPFPTPCCVQEIITQNGDVSFSDIDIALQDTLYWYVVEFYPIQYPKQKNTCTHTHAHTHSQVSAVHTHMHTHTHTHTHTVIRSTSATHRPSCRRC
jgi:hypothetical protein